MTLDRWGVEVRGAQASVQTWDEAWEQFVHFTGDPVATLADVSERDETFVMGPVFTVLYSVLGGSPLDASVVVDNVERVIRRAGPGDHRHRACVLALAKGDLSAAALRWFSDSVIRGEFTAGRFAHDIYLHVGDNMNRVRASEALAELDLGPANGFVAGMHSFSLNEMARYHEAEEWGRRALDADPLDLWARHALAHVYEHTGANDAAFALLRDTTDIWAGQDLLATHMWWHLAVRTLATGDIGAVLAIYDDLAAGDLGPFGLCDASSLLWRVELAGHDVGGRWDELADRWDQVTERHTCGFLDLHAAITYLRRPGHSGADRWFDGLDARPSGPSELDEIFDDVAKPLVAAFRARAAGDDETFLTTLDQLGDSTARIGGSNAQRELITLTRAHTRS